MLGLLLQQALWDEERKIRVLVTGLLEAPVQSVASELELAASGGDLQRVRDLIPNLAKAFAQAAGELAVIVEEEGTDA